MSTDRELLELAAKAAGIDAAPAMLGAGYELAFQGGKFVGIQLFPSGFWNPLTDDGDALRLAVKLGISIVCMEDVDSVGAEHSGHGVMIIEALYDYGVRRAIVRAAAAIGEAMP